MTHYVKRIVVMVVLVIGIPVSSIENDNGRVNKPELSKELLYGFYKYDEKYKGSVTFDKKTYNAWIEAKVNKISNGEQMYNLFGKHTGGGPGGAEWNSDADIVGMIHLPSATNIFEKIDISINHLPVEIPRNIKKSKNGDMFVVFELQSTFWNKQLKPIGEQEYRYIYDVATPDEIKSSDPDWLKSDGTNTYLVENEIVGECFIIEAVIMYKKGKVKKLSGSFHIAYGE